MVEPLHLILDGEEFLVARAVGQIIKIIKSARAAASADFLLAAWFL